MSSQLPWHQLEDQYVREGKTLAQLAEEWGVTRRAIEKHCSKNKWVEKRRFFLQTIAAQRECLLQQLQMPLSELTAEHFATTRMAVELAQQALGSLKRELELSLGHDYAERERDPGSIPAMAALTPVVEKWVSILDKAVRLEREILALQYEHPAKAIHYLLKLGYEITDLPPAASAGTAPTQPAHQLLTRKGGMG